MATTPPIGLRTQELLPSGYVVARARLIPPTERSLHCRHEDEIPFADIRETTRSNFLPAYHAVLKCSTY